MRHGEAVGLEFRFDLIERLPNTRRSHLLIAHAARNSLAARGHGAGHAGLFRGGLRYRRRRGARAPRRRSGPRRSARLAPPWCCAKGQDGVVAAERHATVLGITGVPAFIFDRQYSVSGAQEVETFRARHRSGRGARRQPRTRLVTPAELTGRARGHIEELDSPRCALHAQASDSFLEITRRRCAGGIRSRSAELLSRFRPPAHDLEREIQRRGAGQRFCRAAPSRPWR